MGNPAEAFSGHYKIYNDDAYIMAEKLKKDKVVVNHIITDPPYNISKDNNFDTLRNPRQGVDFGNWDRGNFDLFSWIPLYTQLLDKNGSMIIFCSYRYISHIIEALESKSSGMVAKDVLVWQKSNPMPRNVTRRYVQDMEFAIWAVKKKAKWVFNKDSDKAYQRSFFSSSIVSGNERLGHPTQKSLKIMQDIIRIHTDEGQLILDPFMGTGTTGMAALGLQRRFIGIECDKDYYEIAQKRLQESYGN